MRSQLLPPAGTGDDLEAFLVSAGSPAGPRPSGSTSSGDEPLAPRLAPAPRVDVAVTCEWAERAVAHALREVGAVPVPTRGAALQQAPSGDALVYDLSPWDQTAITRWRHVDATCRKPVLLYLPPTGSAFAVLSTVEADRPAHLQIQSRDPESLGHLERAARALVAEIPRTRIMRLLQHAIPNLSSAAFLFGHRALAVLGSGQRPTVGSLARALGFTPRTLQRRFAAEGLLSPKALLDWLTLAHIHATAECQEVSVARAAARARLTANDLYRLRRRVGRRSEAVGGGRGGQGRSRRI